MNLDLLFNVYKLTGDEKYKNVAVRHAQTTMKNHFRPDYTSYHVVSYNNDGSVEIKQTQMQNRPGRAAKRGEYTATLPAIAKPGTRLSCRKPFTLQT